MNTTTDRRRAVNETVNLIQDGQSSNKAAATIGKRYDVTGRTIQRWATKLGQPLGNLSSYDVPQKAIEGHRAQAEAGRERIRLLILEKAEDLLKRMDEPHVDFKGKDAAMVTYPVATSSDVRNYAMSFAVLLDKYRLEMGESTSRSEITVADAESVVDAEILRLSQEHAASG